MGRRRTLAALTLPQRRRVRRRATLTSMLLAGSAFLVPHAGKLLPKARQSAPSTQHRASVGAADTPPLPVASIVITSDFRLPPQAFDHLIKEAADRYRLDTQLIRAVIQIESAFNPLAVSSAGAMGLMQLMPAVAAELGVNDAFDPRQNIMGGVKYLRQLLEAHGGDLALALASYNAGPGNVAKYGGVPPFRETRNYIRKIGQLIDDGRGELTLD